MAKKLALVAGVPRMQEEAALPPIYDETHQPGDVTTGNPVTLPNSGSYEGDELQVYLNGQPLDFGVDWNTVGGSPYTQLSFTFDLVSGDDVRYRVLRSL